MIVSPPCKAASPSLPLTLLEAVGGGLGASKPSAAEGLVGALAVRVRARTQEAGAPHLRKWSALVAVVGANVIVLEPRIQLRARSRILVQRLCGLGEFVQVPSSM